MFSKNNEKPLRGPSMGAHTINEFQQKGTTLAITFDKQAKKEHFFVLMDTGAVRSSHGGSGVLATDGSDLGSIGSVELRLLLGNQTVTQEFIVSRRLQQT